MNRQVVGERAHADHRGDADCDAQEEEDAAAAMRPASRGSAMFRMKHSLDRLSVRLRTIRPSFRVMCAGRMRRRATRSCVTQHQGRAALTVRAGPAARTRGQPLRVSRLPVGSSASRMRGWFGEARARWPPAAARRPRAATGSDGRDRQPDSRRASDCARSRASSWPASSIGDEDVLVRGQRRDQVKGLEDEADHRRRADPRGRPRSSA